MELRRFHGQLVAPPGAPLQPSEREVEPTLPSIPRQRTITISYPATSTSRRCCWSSAVRLNVLALALMVHERRPGSAAAPLRPGWRATRWPWRSTMTRSGCEGLERIGIGQDRCSCIVINQEKEVSYGLWRTQWDDKACSYKAALRESNEADEEVGGSSTVRCGLRFSTLAGQVGCPVLHEPCRYNYKALLIIEISLMTWLLSPHYTPLSERESSGL